MNKVRSVAKTVNKSHKALAPVVVTLPSGRPIPQPNPTQPFRKG